ncbi:hypothetical protein [Geotalea toluenoxydans]
MQKHLIGILLSAICIGGCAHTLPPREDLTQAVTKSFSAPGFNYSSKSRITDLTLPEKVPSVTPSKKTKLALETGVEVIRSLSINVDGAVDMKAKKSQVLYALRYDRDNVEFAIKVPMLVDYGTQTVYVGTSIYTTVLETLFPQAPSTKGKLVRIDLNKLLQEGAARKPQLANLVGLDLLSGKNMDLINEAIKAAVLKELPQLKDSCFSDQALSDQDKQAGVTRRIRVQLGYAESVALGLGAMASVAEALHQQEIISNDIYNVLLTFTDPKMMGDVMEKFSLTARFDVGVASSGHVSFVEGQYDVADRKGLYRVGIANVSTFSNYGAPSFTMAPGQDNVVDFTELLKAIAAPAAENEADDAATSPEKDHETRNT